MQALDDLKQAFVDLRRYENFNYECYVVKSRFGLSGIKGKFLESGKVAEEELRCLRGLSP